MISKWMSGVSTAALALLLVPAVYTDEPAGDLPSDLALVPGNAFGFSHLRATDVWKSESMKEIRELV